jgi:hypothetical protein
MPNFEQGFQSDGLRAALEHAVAGRPAELERLLARAGAVVTVRPNLRLAAAFGVEVATLPPAVLPLLRRLAAEDAAPDTDRAFLPIAAAHGWAARVRAGLDVEEAWAALAELAADERAAVRLGARDALVALGTRSGGADELLARGLSWLAIEDREQRIGAVALVLDTLAERRLVAGLRDPAVLIELLSRALAEVASAPRSAERSDARRRLLLALPPALAGALASAASAEPAQAWFRKACGEAVQHDVRDVLSKALARLRAPGRGAAPGVAEELRRALEASAKPLRDPTRLRPGTGRGKATRRIR